MSDFRQDFKVEFKDRDGSLIVNRMTDRMFYFKGTGRWADFDDRLARVHLDRDAREKGVRIVSYTHDDKGVYVVCDYLSRGRR